jgi:hypothetical protein
MSLSPQTNRRILATLRAFSGALSTTPISAVTSPEPCKLAAPMVAFIRVDEKPHHDSPSLPISLARASHTSRHSYAGVVITERVMTQRLSGWSTWRRSRPGKVNPSIPSANRTRPHRSGQRAPARRSGFSNGHSKRNCRRHGAGSLGRGAADTHGNTGTNVGICFRSHNQDSCVEEQAFMGRNCGQRPGDSAATRERRSSNHKGNFNHRTG